MYRPEYHKECPGCGNAFEATRLNQKFCSIKCKNWFNNRQARELHLAKKEIEQVTEKVNHFLWNNRLILMQNIGDQVEKNDLINQGFKLNYITRFEDLGNRKTRFYCYDIAYEFLDGNTLKIYYYE